MCDITLPTKKDTVDAKNPNSTSAASNHQVQITRVLIVDDNVDVVSTLSQWLKIGGYDVQAAYNGSQAIQLTAEFQPEIILLDIGLPDLNGYDIALQLRKIPDIPKFLLVAVTGYGQGSDNQDFLDAGFDRHFAKPMDLSKLASIGLPV